MAKNQSCPQSNYDGMRYEKKDSNLKNKLIVTELTELYDFLCLNTKTFLKNGNNLIFSKKEKFS